MKRRTASLLLALLLLIPTVLSMIPAGVFAEETAVQITETTDGYEGSLGYGGGIRKKSDGSILFSPYITELTNAVKGGASLSNYTIAMTFTLLKGDGGTAVHTFETVAATLYAGNGDYFDVYLNGAKGNCGFCPTAGEYYDVAVEIYTGWGTDAQTKVFYGTYGSLQAATSISGSSYYTPTSAPVVGTQITETTEGYEGSVTYNGIRYKSSKYIAFSPYITELTAAINAGASVSDYVAELTFTQLAEDGSVDHTFHTVSAAISKGNGTYFDIMLQSDTVDCGFCPTAGATYDIAVEIYSGYGTENAALVFYGTYTGITAAEAISDSSYYDPTPKYVQITETTEEYTGSLAYKGIRKNSAGNILFSPFITELRAEITAGKDYGNFTIVADFSLLAEDGSVEYSFEDISLTPQKSNGNYFDIVLQSSSVNCGFCPTAGKKYDIYVEVYEGETLRYYGTYKNISADSSIAESSYYAPTLPPADADDYEATLSYSFNNALQGSAAGKIYFTVNLPGTYSFYWGDENGNRLTATAGEKILTYSALTSVTIEGSEGGNFAETVIGFTAIPSGAKTLLVLDAYETPVKTLELPEDKTWEAEYNYSFGVVSDVHYNYFFYNGEDCAIKAMDTAIDFYEAVGAALIAAVGDYSLYAEESSYQMYQAAVSNSSIPVIACGGNHELYAKLDVMFGENGYWRTYMNNGIYDGTMEGVEVLDIADNGIDFTCRLETVNDAVFVSLSQWYWDGHSINQGKLVEPEQLVWLEEQLEQYKDQTVYFLFHTYLADDDGETVDGEGDMTTPIGGYTYGGHYNTYVEDEQILRALLTEYDNVIWFNGHSHYEYSIQEFNQNLNIYDYEGTTATMVHVPSLTNPRTVTATSTNYGSLKGVASQGALMFVYDDVQIHNGMDLWGEEILSYACYIIYESEDSILSGEIEGTDLTWTYDAQLNSLRILGEGAIPDYTSAEETPWASVSDGVMTLYIGTGVTAIGENAFAGMTSLERAEIKEGTQIIAADAFAGDNAMAALILPESLTTVEDGAFSGISSISSLTYGGTSVTWAEIAIGEENDCLASVTIVFEKIEVTFVVGDTSVLVSVESGESPEYDGLPAVDHEDETKYYPFTGWTDGTTTYAAGTALPGAIANITYTAVFGEEADRYVTGTLSDGAIVWTLDHQTGTLTISGEGDMPTWNASSDQPWQAYVSEIITVVVKSGVTSVGKNAFSRLTNLQTAVIEEGVTTLAMDALAYNTKLTTVYLPSTLKTVGQGSVYQSNYITTIYYGGSEAEWDALCASITTLYNTTLTNAENVIFNTPMGDSTDDNPGDSTGDNTDDNAGDTTGDNTGDVTGDGSTGTEESPKTGDAVLVAFSALMAALIALVVLVKKIRVRV